MVSNFRDSSPLDNCPDASGDDLKGNSKMNHHDLITIQQITNLVERGKSREEIAELIEVTIDSLQVTCSRLGISLRRPRLDSGIRLLPTFHYLVPPVGAIEKIAHPGRLAGPQGHLVRALISARRRQTATVTPGCKQHLRRCPGRFRTIQFYPKDLPLLAQ